MVEIMIITWSIIPLTLAAASGIMVLSQWR